MAVPIEIDWIAEVDRLDSEVQWVYSSLVLPTWDDKERHGVHHALYGYMMVVFSKIDLLSACWRGSESKQTKRMIDFLDKYLDSSHEAHSVAVQVWRHKLMHTGKPRALHDRAQGRRYYWLLHWREHLPREQHFTFTDCLDSRNLNLALVYLIEDLRQAAERYLGDLASSPQLQAAREKVEQGLATYSFRSR